MDEAQLKKYQKRVFQVSVAIFLISLTQPAFYIDRADYDGWSSPIALILIGWIPAISGEPCAVAWFANPLFFLACLSLFKFEKAAIWLSLIALAFGLSFLSVEEVMSSERPDYSKITELKPGYWLWLASMAAFALGLLALKIKKMLEKVG